MKFLSIVAMSLVLVSCSSSPFQEETKEANKIMEHMSQGIKYSNNGFPSKYEESGVKGRYAVGIGKSISEMDSGEQLSESMAVSNAKFNLINSAPTTFSSIVKKTISTSLGSAQEFSQDDISITKVNNLKGVEVKTSDITCRTRMEPIQGSEKYKISRECRAISRVPISELKKAYDFTIKNSLSEKISKSKLERSM